jgi:cytochrome c
MMPQLTCRHCHLEGGEVRYDGAVADKSLVPAFICERHHDLAETIKRLDGAYTISSVVEAFRMSRPSVRASVRVP